MDERRFRAALPHQLDGPGPTKVDVPVYIERVEEQEAEILSLRNQLEGAAGDAERWRRVVVAAYSLVAYDEGRSPDEIVQELREDLHDALGGQ